MTSLTPAELIRRYVAAVARDLPAKERTDISAELGDVLSAQVEGEEERLGRTLTLDEAEALLIGIGHPVAVAGRYRKVQHLIGPEVFPYWWATTRVALTIVLGIYVVLLVTEFVATEDSVAGLMRLAPNLLPALLATLGAMTLAFVVIERVGPRGRRVPWKPRELPPVRPHTRGRFEATVELGMGLIVMLWWVGLIHFRNVIPATTLQVDLAPVWAVWFWPILGYIVVEFATNLIALLRPGLYRFVQGLMLARYLVGAGIMGAISQAGHLLDISSSTIPPQALAKAQIAFDGGMKAGIAGTMVLFLVLAGVSAWRLWAAPLAHTEGRKAAI